MCRLTNSIIQLKRYVHGDNYDEQMKQEAKILSAKELEAQVDEMFADYNDAAEKLGKEKIVEVKKREAIPELQVSKAFILFQQS